MKKSTEIMDKEKRSFALFFQLLLPIIFGLRDVLYHTITGKRLSPALYEKYGIKPPSETLVWRVRIFLFMWGGYVLYYFSRKSFTIAIPVLMEDLQLDKAQIGMIASALTLCYGLSKFTGGILADLLSPRLLVALGLVLTGAINIFFGFSSSLLVFIFWWGLNGWCQGLGATPCARLLVEWYPQRERGRWWSYWNTSHNVGAISIALLVGYLLLSGSWRLALFVPGIICMMGGALVVYGLRDSPQSVGLPPTDGPQDGGVKHNVKNSEEKPSVKEILFTHLLTNRPLLLLSLVYFLVYVVRIGVCDWTIVYLSETKNYSLQEAVKLFIFFEIGGFLGNLVAGWASDTLFAGRRGPVNALFMAGAAASVYAMWSSPASSWMVTALTIFSTGFFIFGPQMLVGVQAAEAVDPKVAASSNGFVNLFGYLGASAAGYPLGLICKEYGWDGFFFAIVFCASIALLLLTPLWSLQAYKKKEEVSFA